jgi:hypothetical protein
MKKWLQGFVLFAFVLATLSGCRNTNISKPPYESSPEPSSAISEENTEETATPPNETDNREIGVGKIVLSDTTFFRIGDLPESDRFLSGINLRYLALREESVIPSYLPDLETIVFPAVLVKGTIKSEVFFEEVPFDLTGVTDYDSLVIKIRKTVPALNSFVIKPSVVDLYANGRFYENAEIAERAVNGKTYLFYFRNSEYGIIIDSMWQDDGMITVRYDAKRNVLIIPDTIISSYSAMDDTYVVPMPLAEALSIAESDRSAGADVAAAQLVYSRFPEEWGDDNYHLSWRIDTESTAYFINSESGAKYVSTKSD